MDKKLSNLNTSRETYADKLTDSDFDIKHEAIRFEGILTGNQG